MAAYSPEVKSKCLATTFGLPRGILYIRILISLLE
jgi:hypothetical protein